MILPEMFTERLIDVHLGSIEVLLPPKAAFYA